MATDHVHSGDIAELSSEHRAYLQQETEHFYRSELAHEQRASWLLALASGLLLALWRIMAGSDVQAVHPAVAISMLAHLGSLATAVLLSIWALWPLGGGLKPGVLGPMRRKRARSQLQDSASTAPPSMPEYLRGPIDPIVWRHYTSHRRRAELKGRRVVRATLSLFFALFIGACNVVLDLFL